ncbi:hypothetical protein [Ewingella americana]
MAMNGGVPTGYLADGKVQKRVFYWGRIPRIQFIAARIADAGSNPSTFYRPFSHSLRAEQKFAL